MDGSRCKPWLPSVVTRRRARAQQAAATRQDVIAAGIELLAPSRGGRARPSPRSRNGQASRSRRSMQGSVRSGACCVRPWTRLWSVTPIRSRSSIAPSSLAFRRVFEERVAACAKLVTDIHRRSAGVWRAIVEAASAEAEVRRPARRARSQSSSRRHAQPRADARSAFDGTPARPGLGAARPGDLPQARCRCGHVAKGLRTLHGRRDRRARDDRWDGGTLSIAAVRLAQAATRTRTGVTIPRTRWFGGGQLGDRVRRAQPGQPAAVRADRARAEDRQEPDGLGVAAADRLPEGRRPAGAGSVAAAPGAPPRPRRPSRCRWPFPTPCRAARGAAADRRTQLSREARVYPSRFRYEAPRSLDEAIALLHDGGGEAKVLAGGQSLVPLLKLRFAVARAAGRHQQPARPRLPPGRRRRHAPHRRAVPARRPRALDAPRRRGSRRWPPPRR